MIISLKSCIKLCYMVCSDRTPIMQSQCSKKIIRIHHMYVCGIGKSPRLAEVLTPNSAPEGGIYLSHIQYIRWIFFLSFLNLTNQHKCNDAILSQNFNFFVFDPIKNLKASRKLNNTFNISSEIKFAKFNQPTVHLYFNFIKYWNFPQLWHLVLLVLSF